MVARRATPGCSSAFQAIRVAAASMSTEPISGTGGAVVRTMSKMLTRLEQSLIDGLTKAAEWVVGLRWEIKTTPLADHECEAAGLPLGSSVRDVFSWPLANGARWRLAVYNHGDFIDVRVLGWAIEVHYIPNARAL